MPPWNRTNLLLAQAAERLGARLSPFGEVHTDQLAWLEDGGRRALIAKARSPYLSQIAQCLANDKARSRAWLRAHGLPGCPAELLDERFDPRSAAGRRAIDGWLEAAGPAGLTIKPNATNRALAVCPGLTTARAVIDAMDWARGEDPDEEWLVEPAIEPIGDGDRVVDLRVAVIGGRPRAAAYLARPELVGDGRTSPRAFIERLNGDPRRQHWQAPATVPFDVIELDEGLARRLEVYGLALDEPVPQGQILRLVGEEAAIVDVTERVDPGWLALAARACAVLGVDVGGVDLRGAVSAFEAPPATAGPPWLLEVNVSPALHLHALPTEGAPRPVFEDFVEYCLQRPGAPAPPAWPFAGG